MSEGRFDVLDRFAPMFEQHEPPFEGFLRRRDRKRRNQRITAGAVGMAVFLAAVWIVTTAGPFDRTQTPGVSAPPATTGPTVTPRPAGVGFIGLPPEGAAPSTPESGELVLSLYGRSTTDPGLFRAYVYADGRIIWDKEGDLPYGANEVTTGFLEQRLTPEGIQRLRSEVVSTGLFDHDLTLLGGQLRQKAGGPEVPVGDIWGTVQVREGDRLVSVSWSNPDMYPQDPGTVATPEQASALERLDALLTHPASWLPASAWEDREIRAYVASRYAACYSEMHGSHGPSRVLSRLPATAEDLLRGRDRTRFDVGSGDYIYCSDVATEEARALADALNAAGIHQDDRSSANRLGYSFEASPGRAIDIYFEPYLPDGEFLLCSPCR